MRLEEIVGETVSLMPTELTNGKQDANIHEVYNYTLIIQFGYNTGVVNHNSIDEMYQIL